MEETQQQIEALRALYASTPAYRPFFEELGSYVNNMRTVKVDVIHRRLGGKRGTVVQAFRALEELDLGIYIKGTWGHPSRFDFSSGTGPVRIGLLAQGVEDEDELPDEVGENEIEDFGAEGNATQLSLHQASMEDIIKELKARGAQSVHVSF